MGDHAREVYSAFKYKKVGWVVGIESEVSRKLGDRQCLASDTEVAAITVYKEALLGVS